MEKDNSPLIGRKSIEKVGVEMKELEKQAINLIFDKLIVVQKEGKDRYIAIDPLTNLAGLGLTKDEAVENLKNTIFKHIEILAEIHT